MRSSFLQQSLHSWLCNCRGPWASSWRREVNHEGLTLGTLTWMLSKGWEENSPRKRKAIDKFALRPHIGDKAAKCPQCAWISFESAWKMTRGLKSMCLPWDNVRGELGTNSTTEHAIQYTVFFLKSQAVMGCVNVFYPNPPYLRKKIEVFNTIMLVIHVIKM